MVLGWKRKKYSSRHSKNTVRSSKEVIKEDTNSEKRKKATWEKSTRKQRELKRRESENYNLTDIYKIPDTDELYSHRDAAADNENKTTKKSFFGKSKWESRKRKNLLIDDRLTDDGLKDDPEKEELEELYSDRPLVTYSPEISANNGLETDENEEHVDIDEQIVDDEVEEQDNRKVSLGIRILQFSGALIIFVAAIVFCYIWTIHSEDDALPAMVMPQSYLFEAERSVKALLLWHETVLTSSVSGSVQLTSGGKIAAVAANDIVATVMSKNKNVPIRAKTRGYFVPGLDGAEGKWGYGKLWAGSEVLPDVPEITWIKDLSPLGAKLEVGKLIKLPQIVRAVFYLDLTDELEKSLSRGVINLRRYPKGPKWAADVRVFSKYDIPKAKVVIDMPYFSMDMVQSRETTFWVCSEEVQGLLVPESSVVMRKGSLGVFELVGDRIIFRNVVGKPIGDGKFFISSGLVAGNSVILDAANAKEKRVRLW